MMKCVKCKIQEIKAFLASSRKFEINQVEQETICMKLKMEKINLNNILHE